MANVLVDESSLEAIADTIRSKLGVSDTYLPSEMADAIDDIGGGVTPTGTKQISITQNGTTTEDVTNYASAEITANVPNSYTASDEGKVVNNGALVSQSSDTVTDNGTYDTTLINSLLVDVASGGGITADGIASGAEPTGDITLETATTIREHAFSNSPNLESIHAIACTRLKGYIASNSGLKTFVGEAPITGDNFNVFSNAANLEAVDMNFTGSYSNGWYSNCARLTTLILRKTSVTTLASTAALNGTPFASNGAGGTLYVPSALISSYQSATNWSTILGYANNSIQAIEGSYYETHYADGTVIA